MQILRYNAPFGGRFELPLLAAIRYIADEIRYHDIRARLDLWHELCAFKYTQQDVIDLGNYWAEHLGYVAAALIERHSIVSYCPHCQTYFSPKQIRRETWDDGVCYIGRRYTCTQAHILLMVKDTHYIKPSSV